VWSNSNQQRKLGEQKVTVVAVVLTAELVVSSEAPFPQIDIIGAVVIVWRVRVKTIRSVLCNIVCNYCAQCDAHTYEQTNSSPDWVLSHCVLLCVVCMRRFVTR